MSMFISEAVAATDAAQVATQGGESPFSIVMLVGIIVLFYFMLIRPQSKRAKEHRALVSQLKAGDEIITAGGLMGKVSSLNEQYIKASIAEGVEICLQRSSVSAVLPKGTLKSI